MYKLNSDSRWFSSTSPEAKIAVFPMQPEDPDSDIAALEKQCKHSVGGEVDSNRNLAKTSSEQQFEHLLSNLLKYGVLIASAIVLVGGILYLIRHAGEPAEYHIFRGEPSEFCSPAGVVKAVLSGSSRGIIQLGMLLLIATPIIRVIISLLAFLIQRIFTYVIITLLVLTALIYSLIGAYY